MGQNIEYHRRMAELDMLIQPQKDSKTDLVFFLKSQNTISRQSYKVIIDFVENYANENLYEVIKKDFDISDSNRIPRFSYTYFDEESQTEISRTITSANVNYDMKEKRFDELSFEGQEAAKPFVQLMEVTRKLHNEFIKVFSNSFYNIEGGLSAMFYYLPVELLDNKDISEEFQEYLNSPDQVPVNGSKLSIQDIKDTWEDEDNPIFKVIPRNHTLIDLAKLCLNYEYVLA